MTLVPVPTKTARSHSDIKGRRPFDVPASIYHFSEWRPAKPSTGKSFSLNTALLSQSGINIGQLQWIELHQNL